MKQIQKPCLILLAARPGVGIKTFARLFAADSIIDATGLGAAEIANKIRQLKSEENLQKQMIVLAQLGRMLPGKNYERPQISDLRGLDDALPEIDTIWLLDRKFTRTHREEDKHSAELIVINQQDCSEKEIPLTFDPKCKGFNGMDYFC